MPKHVIHELQGLLLKQEELVLELILSSLHLSVGDCLCLCLTLQLMCLMLLLLLHPIKYSK